VSWRAFFGKGERASLRAGLRNFLPDVGKRAHRPGLAARVRSVMFEGFFSLSSSVFSAFAVLPSTSSVDDNVLVCSNLIAAMEDEFDGHVAIRPGSLLR